MYGNRFLKWLNQWVLFRFKLRSHICTWETTSQNRSFLAGTSKQLLYTSCGTSRSCQVYTLSRQCASRVGFSVELLAAHKLAMAKQPVLHAAIAHGVPASRGGI